MTGKTVVVIGGSSGIGFAVANACRDRGARVWIAARSATRLEQARASLGSTVFSFRTDMAKQADVQQLFREVGSLDHLVITAADFRLGRILDTDVSDIRTLLEDRFWGTYNSVRYAAPRMNSHGSITLTSGILGSRPAVGTAVTAAGVAAIEAFGRVAALELAPIRVNTVCPGLIDTPMLDAFGERKNQILQAAADSLLVKRVGRSGEVAQSIVLLMTNEFVTGSVLHIDGGALIC